MCFLEHQPLKEIGSLDKFIVESIQENNVL